MNLYLISQTVNSDYDTYDSAVVVAESEDQARLILPGCDGRWTTPENVQVKCIGVAVDGLESGTVICIRPITSSWLNDRASTSFKRVNERLNLHHHIRDIQDLLLDIDNGIVMMSIDEPVSSYHQIESELRSLLADLQRQQVMIATQKRFSVSRDPVRFSNKVTSNIRGFGRA